MGRRVVQFADLPIKLLMPKSFTKIQEIALKTIPSASKIEIEIKRVLKSLYGFEVEKVQTLNMEGKKKKRGGFLEEEAQTRSHWLDDRKEAQHPFRAQHHERLDRAEIAAANANFPWSSMRSGRTTR
ncbi:unnamed protein product [Sphenostylis stenocarpa]|uniref:Large ribosomal subunit protein uL23m n=1 Tax=Sphenostylis stenocarpa TaxID=92480 RepID=A0AA86RW47_9FABA|nr:unnamed protein product [Sphenostylis stenocarpa]